MWRSLPVPVWFDSDLDGFVRERLRACLAFWCDADGVPLFSECREESLVGLCLRLSSRDARGRRVWGALFSWDEVGGTVLSFVRGTVFVHPHVPPHRLKEFVWHELGHALGFRDTSPGVPALPELLQPRAWVGPSWDGASEFLASYDQGLSLLETDPSQAIELLGRAVLILGSEFGDGESLAKAYLALSDGYHKLRDDDLAREALRRASVLSVDRGTQSRVLCWEAGFLAREKDVRGALRVFRRARAAAVAGGDWESLATIEYTLGTTLDVAGRQRFAQRCFARGVDLVVGQQGEDGPCTVLLGQLRVAGLLCARDAVGAVRELTENVGVWAGRPLDRGTLLLRAVTVAVLQRSFALAVRAALLALECFEGAGAAGLSSMALEELAWCSRVFGRWDDAFAWLDRAVLSVSVELTAYGKARWYAVYEDFCRASGAVERLSHLPAEFVAARESASADDMRTILDWVTRQRQEFGVAPTGASSVSGLLC